MQQIEIYTTPFCGFCSRAKQLLNAKNLPFREIDVSRDRGLRSAMTRRAGGSHTVPQIFVGGQHVGGCSELLTLERQGRLDALLAL
ncbi:glutaredoxin 3 [Pseudooceanicola sp. CBS1P-1]|uniref:Glutaredoxin n=1 Tax=Pseudooceanicola albus TaxID=2692189 RepID=A0A6L7GAC3_9RHOB|nr:MULTISPECIES: glutaredoxin 3 [Pseudooceanicola]MBT9384467.1 glutaredoxin 3 [Pseudooceanicola endophyticus]MXN20632.1 glutaredoxin 3 [Pseudooceanicola albus]